MFVNIPLYTGKTLRKSNFSGYYHDMKVTAIIVAAGSGTRLGAKIPKALVDIAGKPMVRWSAEKFCEIELIDSIIVLTPVGYEERFERALAGLSMPITMSVGGATRTDSVIKGIELVPDDCDIVAIHDAARPLVKIEDIRRVIDIAEKYGAATLATPVSDTLKIVENEIISETVDRSRYWAVQTPQVFGFELFRQALAKASRSSTDDCANVERYGHPVHIVRGSRKNIKITYSEDLDVAEAILKGGKCT